VSRLHQNVPLAEQVASQLRRRIAEGEFPVGARLPTEMALAADLGVSRNSVREALRSLVHAGLLRARAGDGTYVTAVSDLAPAVARRIELDRAADVAEVRLLLEREGARLAAIRATTQQRDQLRRALVDRSAADDPSAYTKADLALHNLLLEASGNALLAELYRGTGGVEDAHRDLNPGGQDFRTLLTAMADIDAAHVDVVDAVIAGDPEAAADAAERMVRLVIARVTENNPAGTDPTAR
jgi:DNA-binding FadR family transcriptional regulator